MPISTLRTEYGLALDLVWTEPLLWAIWFACTRRERNHWFA